MKKNYKTAHYFLLSPYQRFAFTRCPKCDGQTRVRRFPLVVHVEPQLTASVNKNCRYCPFCDLIVVRQHELEAQLVVAAEMRDPSVIGNPYLVIGTLSREDYHRLKKDPKASAEAARCTLIFKDEYQLN
jgi:hypothetical protein